MVSNARAAAPIEQLNANARIRQCLFMLRSFDCYFAAVQCFFRRLQPLRILLHTQKPLDLPQEDVVLAIPLFPAHFGLDCLNHEDGVFGPAQLIGALLAVLLSAYFNSQSAKL